jgi:hypothetical protein
MKTEVVLPLGLVGGAVLGLVIGAYLKGTGNATVGGFV